MIEKILVAGGTQDQLEFWWREVHRIKYGFMGT
jgi:hypothetical protein